jgi:hypothetical protein
LSPPGGDDFRAPFREGVDSLLKRREITGRWERRDKRVRRVRIAGRQVGRQKLGREVHKVRQFVGIACSLLEVIREQQAWCGNHESRC